MVDRRPRSTSKRRRASRGRKKAVSKKAQPSIRRKRRGGFKANSLSRKTCTEVFEKKPGFSRGHYSACKWLRPDLYKETKKGVFDWTRRAKSKKPTKEIVTAREAVVATPVLIAPPIPTDTTVTHSIADSPGEDGVMESTTVTKTEPSATFTTSDDVAVDEARSESSVNSRPMTETLQDMNLNQENASTATSSSGGQRFSKRQKRRSRRLNSKRLHAIFRA